MLVSRFFVEKRKLTTARLKLCFLVVMLILLPSFVELEGKGNNMKKGKENEGKEEFQLVLGF